MCGVYATERLKPCNGEIKLYVLWMCKLQLADLLCHTDQKYQRKSKIKSVVLKCMCVCLCVCVCVCMWHVCVHVHVCGMCVCVSCVCVCVMCVCESCVCV